MFAENIPVPEIIPVTDQLTLRAVDERYVTDLHQLVEKNKLWLQHSLSWPAAVDSEGNNVHQLAPLHWRDKIAKEHLLG